MTKEHTQSADKNAECVVPEHHGAVKLYPVIPLPTLVANIYVLQ